MTILGNLKLCKLPRTLKAFFKVSRVIKRNEGVELAKNYYFVQLPLSEALKSLILESEIQGRDEILSLL